MRLDTNMFKIELPKEVEDILKCIKKAGFEAYIVGGCVRDSLLNRVPTDWDITTNAKPEDVKKLFARTIDTGLIHGTVTVMIGKMGYEITTYRIDGDYDDGRHPNEVTFTSDLRKDLERRDFTINAMAYEPEHGLVDLFDGVKDLQERLIRAVGDPNLRFLEDALRMMRAIRFAAGLGFSIDYETKEAIRAHANLLSKVSAERIQVELVKLLVSDHPELIRELYDTGLTNIMFPEFDKMMNTVQNNPHHCYNVGEHTIEALKQVSNSKVLRLAVLCHDIGKIATRSTDENGVDHFYGHANYSEQFTLDRLRALRFDNDTIQRVSRLVLFHDYEPGLKESDVRRMISKVTKEAMQDLYYVKRADILAQSDYLRAQKLELLEKRQGICEKILEKQECVQLRELKISGKDLIALKIPQGKKMGQILNQLLDIVIEDPTKNERDLLLQIAQRIYQENITEIKLKDE